MRAVPEPVVVTGDESLLAALGRAAAAASVQPQVVRDPRAVATGWAVAPMVLVGADQLAALVELALPSRGQVYVVCLSAPSPDALRDALDLGAAGLLELPVDETRLVDLLNDSADGGSALGRVIGVVGGTGGAGASTFAAALGVTLADRQGSALLVDADRAGGGADQLLGLPPGGGVRWDALAEASGRLSARSLHETLPAIGLLSVVTWPLERPSVLSVDALRSVLSAGRRGYPAVVVDLPRAAPDVLDEVVPRCDLVVLVCTVTVPALAACLLFAEQLPDPGTSVLLRGRGGIDTHEVERLLGFPVRHRMPDQRGLDEAVALGLGPLRYRRGPLARAAQRIARVVEGGHPR